MAPEWFYEADAERRYFAVYDDAKGSCKKRRFFAPDGGYADESPAFAGGFAERFRSDIKRAYRIGELRGRPNLESAVRAGKLPNDVLGELKGLLRAIHGIGL